MKKKIETIFCTLQLMLLIGFPAYANGLADLPLVQGTEKLIGDATPIIVTIGGLVSLALGVWRTIQWQAADEQEKPRAKKKIWETVGGAILITCIVGVITTIVGYYGGSIGN